MTHGSAVRTLTEAPTIWTRAGSALTGEASKLAPWVIVKIGPELAKDSGTALYIPASGEIEISSNFAFPGLRHSDFHINSLWKLKNAGGMGALYHEMAHARFSTETPKSLQGWKDSDGIGFSPREIDVFIALEESRIEFHAINKDASIQKFLRSMTIDLLLKEFKIADNKYGASIGAALTLARFDAGSIPAISVDSFREEVLKTLSESEIEDLRKIWVEFQSLNSYRNDFSDIVISLDLVKARELIREWIKIVKSDEDDSLEDLATALAKILAGIEDSDDDSEMGEAFKSIGREMTVEAETEILDEVRRVKAEMVSADRAMASVRYKENEKARAHVYSDTPNRCTIGKIREPKDDERKAAVAFAKKLSKVTAVTPVTMRVDREVPPGRLIGRQALQQSAQIANGGQVTATPFRATQRLHTENDKVRLGILSDVSGSMYAAQEPAGILTYILARGAQVADAQTSTVLFGYDARGISRAKGKVDSVMIPVANAGTEAIKPALQAVDAELNLLGGEGSRILIIFSDGQLVSGTHADFADTWMRLAQKAGVHVIWVDWFGIPNNHGYGEQVTLKSESPTEVANILGDKILEIVKKGHKS